ncbi:MAG: cation:dicarboxylase symporter family transporter [Alphaproteobacteria bacterium]|nr:cation:dicarboxylase symporter family transporter [Alphaproteobacteria bacterium]
MLKKHQNTLNIASIMMGAILGYTCAEPLLPIAQFFSSVFIKIIKFIGVPLIFFSLLGTILSTGTQTKVKNLLKKTFQYTFGTTLAASFIGLVIYKMLRPSEGVTPLTNSCGEFIPPKISYLESFLKIFPSNILDIFIENNIAGAVILAALLGVVGKKISRDLQHPLYTGTAILSEMFLTIAQYVSKTLPLFLWAFIFNFVQDIKTGFLLSSVAQYIFAIMLANSFHAFVVLPFLLKKKGISPWETARLAMPAISVASLTKSSNIAIPTTMKSLESMGVKPFIARFTAPVCATINMNGCSIFIFTTTSFMTEIFTGHLDLWKLSLIALLSTFIAIGNAGVPMGCFFLTINLLGALDVPTYMMGALLPFFIVLDMFETGINVWSDIVITRCIDKKFKI